MSMRFCLQGVFRYFVNFPSLYTLQVLAVKSRTIQVRGDTNDTNLAQRCSLDVHGEEE